MNTKLTLTIDQSVIDRAKKYARQSERSLSDLVESYLKALTGEKKYRNKQTPTATVKSLQGAFKLPEGFDYKRELSERLSEKYL